MINRLSLKDTNEAQFTSEIRNAINDSTLKRIKSENLTWNSIQKIRIQDTWNSPVSARTLYRIAKGGIPTQKNLHKILKFFKIPYTENYGIFQLIKIDRNEE